MIVRVLAYATDRNFTKKKKMGRILYKKGKPISKPVVQLFGKSYRV